MTGKSDYLENAWLLLLLNGLPIAGLADNAAVGALATLYVALHTADPTDAGDQTVSECTYGLYVRLPVVRSAVGWVVSGNTWQPVNQIAFPACNNAVVETARFASIGTLLSGAGKILMYGPISPVIPIVLGTAPILTTGSIGTED